MSFDPVVHRRRSMRLKHYDYSQPGAYFVTMVTHQRLNLFGDVINDEAILNNFGRIVEEEWLKSAEIRREIEMDQYVIMPNHVHGVIILNQLWATRRSPLQTSARGPSKRSLGAFVAGFKLATTKRIDKLGRPYGGRVWQRNYYEHVIRNEKALNKIREYILQNPLKWALDPENPNVGATGGSPIREEPWQV